MRDFFVLDGKSSIDFNTWVATSNLFDGAEHDDESIEIPGRNGTIVLSNNRYKNFIGKMTCYIPKEMQSHVNALRAFLSSNHQYRRLEENLHPDLYLMARYKGGFSLSQSDRAGAAFDLVFDCKPQKFLKIGEIPVQFVENGSIFNFTSYPSKPRIRCYGSAGSVTIGGISVNVSSASSYADIDSELMEVYEGKQSLNSKTVLTNGEFPVIKPGESTVSFTGFSYIEITPNWYTI